MGDYFGDYLGNRYEASPYQPNVGQSVTQFQNYVKYVNTALDRDRAYDTDNISVLLEEGKKILTAAKDITELMENAILNISVEYANMKAEYKVSSLGVDIGKLGNSLNDNIYQDTMDRMDRFLPKLMECIPEEDTALSRSMDNIEETLISVKGRIGDLKSMLETGDINLNYEEFTNRLDEIKSGWDETTEDLAERLAQIENDLLGVTKDATPCSIDPVNLSTGNFIYEHEDMEINGEIPLTFHRYYNSKTRGKRSLGRCFMHCYDSYLDKNAEKRIITVVMGDGQKKTFRIEKDGTCTGLHSAMETLVMEGESYTFKTPSGEKTVYDKEGRMIRKENMNGRGITFSYDEEGRLKKAETDNNTYFEYRYNDEGLLINVTDHTGRSTELAYERKKLAMAKTPSGSVYTYRYGENGRIEETVNSRGYIAVRNAYDDSRRVTRQEFPDGGFMEYAYDDKKRHVILTERNGSRTTYVHDSKYRCTDILYEDGTKEHSEYNSKNRRTLYTDRNGSTTRYAYDNRGNLTQVINALGDKISMTYNADNRLIVYKINGKEKRHNNYDDRGNMVSSVGADGNGNRITYDEYGRPVCVENADGSTVSVTYDNRGNIAKIRDTLGKLTEYKYDELNRVIGIIDAKGNKSGYEYDNAGNIIKYINADGKERLYTYNESKKITQIVDFNGSKIVMEYNALNKLEKVINQEGGITKYEYDKMWNVSKVIKPNGAVTKYSYNRNNRIETVTDALDNKIYLTYDNNGNRTSIKDASGANTVFAYDALGRLIKLTDPEGAVTDYEYDDEGRLIKITDALGNETVRTYDIMGRLSEERNSTGETRTYEYTALGNIKSVTTETGLKICYYYLPGETKISGIKYPNGTKETYTYDANGNLESKTDFKGYTIRYGYDCLNWLTEVSGSEGEHIYYTYDEVGNVISGTDTAGSKTYYEYSLTGKLIKVTDALGNEAEYTYDENGMLTGILQKGTVSETLPRKTEYERDILGRIVKVTDALGGQEHYKYNARGELTEKTDKEGYLTKYGYTMGGRIDYIGYADGRAVRLSYNSLGQLEEINDWTGITRITNDASGRTTQVRYPDGKTAAYTYGAAGKRTSLTYPDGATVYYGYDELLRLTEIREKDAYIRYNYNDLGMLAETSFSNGMTTGYEYDARGLLISLVHKDREGILDEYKYKYDRAANRTEIVKNRRGLPKESGCYNYEYDMSGRLCSVSKDGEALRKYEYDAYGNRTGLMENNVTKTYHYNALNQLISEVDITNEGKTEEQFGYDKRGNLTQVLMNGQMLNQYSYGALNRLEWAKNSDGEEACYIYNGLGHRIGKQEKRLKEQGTYSDRRIDYVIDLTKQYNNLLWKEEDGKIQTFLWDNNVAGIIEEDKFRKFYLHDEMGSPARLADAEGSIQETYGYDEFGRDLYHNRGHAQPFGYTGYQPDDIAGTYYAQAREYMPSAGKFAARDLDKYISIKNMHSINLYNYCMSNPIRYGDPTGKDLEDLYPLTVKDPNDAVQISVSGNDITIDVYVDFKGDEDLTTYNGTPCKDLAIAGIENWSGNYLDVFGEDVRVTVNVYEENENLSDSQKYVDIYLVEEIERSCSYYIMQKIFMYTGQEDENKNQDYIYTNDEYARVVSHEMGHIFGIGDGYGEDKIFVWRKDANEAGILDKNDVMFDSLDSLNISNTDICLLIIAYSDGKQQSYTDYFGHKQSRYFEQEGKE